MRKVLTVLLLSAVASTPALARDTRLTLPLAEVLEMGDAKAKLDGSVRFYLAGQKTPRVIAKMSEDVSNHKTNNFARSDETGCQWAALSALLAFQEKAKLKGANAVINIESYYKRNSFKSATEYECHAGAVMAGVTLKGTYAKVAK